MFKSEEVAHINIVDNSGWDRTCTACAITCRGNQPSKLCCTCYWNRSLSRLRSDLKACKRCKDHLALAVLDQIHQEKQIENEDDLTRLQMKFDACGFATAARPKICEHTFCLLGLDSCCACLGKRTSSSKYRGYADGTGVVETSRFANDCTACRGGATSTRAERREVPPEIEHPSPKTCSHDSCLLTLSQCCECSDRRPLESKQREVLSADGFWYLKVMNDGYCLTCKERALPPIDLRCQPALENSLPKIVRTPKNCGHAHCELATPICCACTGDRPICVRSDKYVDDLGWFGGEGEREDRYCPACRDVARVTSAAKSAKQPFPSPSVVLKPSKPITNPTSTLTSRRSPAGYASFSYRICGHGCRGRSRGKCCNCDLQFKLRHNKLKDPSEQLLHSFCGVCIARYSYRVTAALLEEAILPADPQPEAPISRPFITGFVPARAVTDEPRQLAAKVVAQVSEDDDWSCVADLDFSELDSECLVDDTESLCSWVDTGDVDGDCR